MFWGAFDLNLLLVFDAVMQERSVDHTVLLASANARRGEMIVEAREPPAPGGLR
jgi:hypothetical protein